MLAAYMSAMRNMLATHAFEMSFFAIIESLRFRLDELTRSRKTFAVSRMPNIELKSRSSC
jgi:hypothetical protein